MTVREMREQVSKFLSPLSSVSEIYLHGGEPLLAGKQFFREFVAAVRTSSAGRDVKIGVQTNGVLIDEEWVQLFMEGGMKVGLSLDGDAAINDMHRVGLDGRSTYRQVKRGIEVLQKHAVAFGVISVFSNEVAKKSGCAYRVLRHMSELGISEFDLHPAFTPFETSGNASNHNVEPLHYSSFMSSAFDEWLAIDGEKPLVRTFEDFFLAIGGTNSDVCHRSGQCMSIIGVNEGGEMQPCTRPFDPLYAFGNLNATAFAEVVDTRGFRAFRLAELAGQALTASCKWRDFCGNGGCPHERFSNGTQDPGGRHVFCTCHGGDRGGYPELFEHIACRIMSLTDHVPTRADAHCHDFVRSPTH